LEERLNDIRPGKLDSDDLEAMRSLATELRASCQDANNLISTHLANANPFKPFSRRDAVSVGAAVRDAIASFQKGSGSRELLVDAHLEQDFVIQAEAGAIRQVVVNLLNNSLKAVVLRHTVAAAHQISVSLQFDGAGKLIIADAGIGIPKRELARVFEPFRTGDPQYGHGLGLTYVRAAITAYGGNIHVASDVGGGTIITISFPNATAIS